MKVAFVLILFSSLAAGRAPKECDALISRRVAAYVEYARAMSRSTGDEYFFAVRAAPNNQGCQIYDARLGTPNSVEGKLPAAPPPLATFHTHLPSYSPYPSAADISASRRAHIAVIVISERGLFMVDDSKRGWRRVRLH